MLGMSVDSGRHPSIISHLLVGLPFVNQPRFFRLIGNKHFIAGLRGEVRSAD